MAVAFLPGPAQLQEPLAPQVVAGERPVVVGEGEADLLQQVVELAPLERPLDQHVDGDAGVVRAGEPARLEAVHPLVADHHVLNRVVEGVAHVQLSGDVRRRDHDRVGLLGGVDPPVEVASLLPEAVPTPLHALRVVGFRQLHALPLLPLLPLASSRSRARRVVARGS